MHMPLKAISALLSYPTEELQAAKAELIEALGQGDLLPAEMINDLSVLINGIATGDIYDLQETYVGLFDRSRTLSLNLFEHVHGESRDRGPAMVDLVENYRAAGFEPASTELPDHLPVLLEFLAMRPIDEAQEVLADAAHILEVLRTRLTRRESIYAPVFAALLHISGEQADQTAVAELLAIKEDDPDDLEALDQVWEESEVTFAPDPNAGCPQVRDMLAQMDTPRNAPPETAPAAAE
ncbi:nitrate reductase molybdenum cofactor assembly chaperone [Profundibacter sp.]|uniref:nitrate reductase molybdenum cofactor assembly chaperone n=1 Tax=Profundibacter sp. TaxID=3101071 RepID=UPI003D12557C